MKEEYCTCGPERSVTTDCENEWGYWYVCCNCGKKIEDGFHYYNHYDGEDHDDIDDFKYNKRAVNPPLNYSALFCFTIATIAKIALIKHHPAQIFKSV